MVYGPIVYWLGREVFTLVNGVQFSVGLRTCGGMVDAPA